MTQKKVSRWVAVSVAEIILTACINLTQGELSVPVMGPKALLLGQGDQARQLLVWNFRLPRIVLAVLSGATLSLSGAVLQEIIRSPLADTGILGTNVGAGLAVISFISFVKATSITTFVLPLVTLVGGLLAAVGILVTVYHHRLGLTPVRMVLAGVTLGTGVSVFTLLITSRIDTGKCRFVTIRQAGSIRSSNWSFMSALLPWLAIGFFSAMKRHRLLDILQLGDEIAISIGIAAKKEQIISLLLAMMLTASAISVTEGINFLGLLTPHIARKCGFTRQKQVLLLTALFGGLLLSVSDTIGRLLSGNGEMPAGIVIAIIGAPYSLYLLIKTSDSL